MDPSMMGGGSPPDLDAKIQQAVQTAMQTAGAGGGANGGPGSPKQPKPDINTVATDLFQLKKMFLAYLRRQGIELPPDILDGPNRDPSTGAPAISPTGSSDVAPGSSGPTAMGAIKPISPIQPAVMNAISGGGGQAKSGAATVIITPSYILKEASDVLRLYAIYVQNGCSTQTVKMANVYEENNSEIYGNSSGPGRPVTPIAGATKVLRNKAAALSRMFSCRK